MLPNGNPDDLKVLYEKFMALKEAYFRARDLLRVMGDELGLVALQPLAELIESCREDMRALEQINLSKLDQAKAAGDSDYPYSVITWYEDEADDLWSGFNHS